MKWPILLLIFILSAVMVAADCKDECVDMCVKGGGASYDCSEKCAVDCAGAGYGKGEEPSYTSYEVPAYEPPVSPAVPQRSRAGRSISPPIPLDRISLPNIYPGSTQGIPDVPAVESCSEQCSNAYQNCLTGCNQGCPSVGYAQPSGIVEAVPARSVQGIPDAPAIPRHCRDACVVIMDSCIAETSNVGLCKDEELVCEEYCAETGTVPGIASVPVTGGVSAGSGFWGRLRSWLS